MNDSSLKCSCCAGEGIPVSGRPCVCGGRGTQEAELQGFRETCFDLRAALDDIHISAHCIAKAGPLGAPTLQDAWTQFMELGVKAANAIYQARQARKGTS